MTKPYDHLRDKMSSSAKKKAKKKADEIILQVNALNELRKAKEFSQVRLAEVLETSQVNVSKIESRTDMYISTLRSYVEAMGGELEINAKFDNGMVKINSFQNLDNHPPHN